MTIYLICAVDEFDGDGNPFWWSNEGGWSSLSEAVVYTEAEHASLKPPLGGFWVKFEAVA